MIPIFNQQSAEPNTKWKDWYTKSIRAARSTSCHLNSVMIAPSLYSHTTLWCLTEGMGRLRKEPCGPSLATESATEACPSRRSSLEWAPWSDKRRAPNPKTWLSSATSIACIEPLPSSPLPIPPRKDHLGEQGPQQGAAGGEPGGGHGGDAQQQGHLGQHRGERCVGMSPRIGPLS